MAVPCSAAEAATLGRFQFVMVTGLSRASKSSVLRISEGLDYPAVDNLPLPLLALLLAGKNREPLAIGIDTRTRQFDEVALRATIAEFRARKGVDLTVVFVSTEAAVIQRRFSKTRRKHPPAPKNFSPSRGGVTGGSVRAEELLSLSGTWLTGSSIPRARRGPFLEIRLRAACNPSARNQDWSSQFAPSPRRRGYHARSI